MSKTAVTQGIEKLWVVYQNTDSPKEKGELSAIISTFEALLQTEKEQIINAFEEGANCVFSGNDEPSAEQYYSDTYEK